MHSLVFSLTLALILSFPAPQTSTSKAKKDRYAVTFSVRYSYTNPLVQKNSKSLGMAYCGPTKCEGPLDIVINRATQRNAGGLFALGSYMCWPHHQTLTFCTQRGYNKTYGRCPYWQCTIDRPQSCRGIANKRCIYHQHHNGTTWLHIQDPNHDKWNVGVTGALYREAMHSKPTAFISVFCTISKYNTTWDISVLAEDIKQQELSLKASLASTPLLTWPEIIQTTLDILNNTNWLKITSCFLCAAFQQSLLIATPIPLSTTPSFNSSLAADDTAKNFPLAPRQGNLTCILLNTTVRSAPPFKCTHNLTSNATCAPPPLLYWCNGTVSSCINDSILVPCIPVLLTPHLTYYTSGNCSLLAPPQPRAILLPVLIGTALAGTVTALGLSASGLAHSVLHGQHFEALRQINLQSTAESLKSLQRQLTSLAQVTLQNRRALDLLTAEKGGTCLFLQEECCYYINESGIVEQNVKILRELREGILPSQSTSSL
ncbi:ERV-BabFcenv provirus ancestral Env polyprotein-like [Dasypus novemcinctus]|uniref:ERV-BabFcenv provirus ancestral Env polyprotein-like n=1 Tax=Dasypus novemcinctus TaxID=9361 RepID=UPI00265EA93A|nr:ERV-BabFcenv provirus ancestral Env polyprotein-like [Dasypus novemcinctus]